MTYSVTLIESEEAYAVRCDALPGCNGLMPEIPGVSPRAAGLHCKKPGLK